MSAIKARSGGHNLGLKVSSMALYSPYRRSQADYPPQSWRNMCRAEIAEKSENFLQDNCQMWGKCGEILYKNGLQVSVGHLRVPGAGIEPARIAPLVFETSASTDSAIRA